MILKTDKGNITNLVALKKGDEPWISIVPV